MTNEPANEPEFKQPLLMWWVLWAALLSGVFVLYFVSGGVEKSASSAAPASPLWMVGLVPFGVSVVVRWLVLPRIQRVDQAFPWFIVGLAMGEVPCILGLFVFPDHKVELFALGVLAMLELVPYFASGYSTER